MGILTEVSHEYFHYTMPARIVMCIGPGLKLPLCWQPAAARAASHEMTRATKKGLT